jgi:hypothetical protein
MCLVADNDQIAVLSEGIHEHGHCKSGFLIVPPATIADLLYLTNRSQCGSDVGAIIRWAAAAEARVARLEAACKMAIAAWAGPSDLSESLGAGAFPEVVALRRALSDAPPPQGEDRSLATYPRRVQQAFARKVDADIMASIPPSAVAAATARVVMAAKAETEAERGHNADGTWSSEALKALHRRRGSRSAAVDALLAAEAGEKA